MPNFERYRIHEQRRYDQRWVIWNVETEAWEAVENSRWYECGEPYDRVQVSNAGHVYRRVCTKLIGHGGEHGKRDTMDRPALPDGDARGDGAGTDAA